MSDDTISRDVFMTLMREMGQQGSAELVEETLATMGWGTKQAFTKQDVISVMEGLTALSMKKLESPNAMPGVDEDARLHMRELLGALQVHAIPVLQRHPD